MSARASAFTPATAARFPAGGCHPVGEALASITFISTVVRLHLSLISASDAPVFLSSGKVIIIDYELVVT